MRASMNPADSKREVITYDNLSLNKASRNKILRLIAAGDDEALRYATKFMGLVQTKLIIQPRSKHRGWELGSLEIGQTLSVSVQDVTRARAAIAYYRKTHPGTNFVTRTVRGTDVAKIIRTQ